MEKKSLALSIHQEHTVTDWLEAFGIPRDDFPRDLMFYPSLSVRRGLACIEISLVKTATTFQ